MKYIDSDLDFIFVRVACKNKSVRELNQTEFEYWIDNYFSSRGSIKRVDYTKLIQKWSDNEKLNILNGMAMMGARFIMIKRGKARKDFKK